MTRRVIDEGCARTTRQAREYVDWWLGGAAPELGLGVTPMLGVGETPSMAEPHDQSTPPEGSPPRAGGGRHRRSE